ncbi:hypothetical protein Poli38472_011184 [Pythium oligandrum]|uniref:Uncharacterized protein n=1 Tax=Pythium oligandrum TaxID=41045 RepID=A0A8K1CQU1_PYTOL|nr:hypothetical protein Poli38472_011184 [Pythium oligandrum]|eukprot:TMW67564.1 hypothetical protein Poli38472_011184 [Pythium oligandrum]
MSEERWAFLSPWLANSCFSVEEYDEFRSATLHSEFKTFHVQFRGIPHDDIARLAIMRESIELLGLALRLDRNAWQHVASDMTFFHTREFDPDDCGPGPIYPRFTLHPATAQVEDTVRDLRRLSTVFITLDEADRSPEFYLARRRILAMDVHGVLEGYRIPIVLALSTQNRLHDKRSVKAYVAEAKSLVAFLHGKMKNQRRYRFELVGVNFLHSNLKAGGVEAEFVKFIVSSGINMSNIDLDSYDPMAVNAFLRKAMNRRSGQGRIKKLKLGRSGLEEWIDTARLLSQTNMVDEFCTFFGTYGTTAEQRRDMWRWIAYSLFSEDSRSVISKLIFESESITYADITAMEEVFQGRWRPDDPNAPPSDIDEPTADGGQYVCVANDTMVRVDGALVGLASLGLSSQDQLAVVDDDTGTEWMEVRTSAVGHFFVQCGCVVDAGVVSSRAFNRPSSKLRSLMLICDMFEPGAASSFISLVGRGLTALCIPCKSRRWITASDVKQILQSCPNLQFLALQCAEIESMDVFIEAYEQGCCALTTLSLWDVQVSNDSLVTFAEKLKDPQHPMARCLTEFRFIFDDVAHSTSIRRPDERGIQAFLSMLHTNQGLHFFELGLEESDYLVYAPSFVPLDRQELQHRTRGLSPRCKSAFLSAIDVNPRESRLYKRRKQQPDACYQALDEATVRRIFSFCEQRVVRVVSITEIK